LIQQPLLKTENGAGGIGICPSMSALVRASRKHCEHHISKTNEGNFAQFW